MDKEIREKRNFFVNRSVRKNVQWKKFSGRTHRKSLRTQDSKKNKEKLDIELSNVNHFFP